MKRIGRLLLLFSFLIFISSCSDEEVIPNNTAPPDQTIENVTISNYVNRVYVSVLGREASESEKSSGFNILRQNNLSMSSRLQFLYDVFSDAKYFDHLYTHARIDLLNNIDTIEVYQQWQLDSLILTTTVDQNVIFLILADMERLDSLRQVPNDLAGHQIEVTYMHRRCVNNYFYDQINMGTENFVISCFQHFLNRYPTANELSEGKKMSDGTSAVLFLEFGQTKSDFIRIFFTSRDYHEGLAINLYKRFLLRNPTSIEMGNAAQAFSSTHDYVQMQKDILSTNEYIGIE